ncbi:centriole and centriolar satellite protein ofd1 [Conger conger]|uniref:centriole and centriolar satellite protein ofd1 n=1 Tax=Conger conger TaxID=82655 RepID=UPI002A5A5768|nr:centriole and centriolar satellite protein ofd1 [Conger conger]
MSGVKEEVISSDEMRKRLYKTFKNRGVLDTLKTQLRNQLIHELKHPVLSKEGPVRPLLPDPESVLFAASNSMVADHLQSAGYEYTLSVFYPECGLDKSNAFSSRDLLQLMKISPQSPFYKSLASSIQNDNQKGFLMKLLIELSDHHAQRERCHAHTQTSTSPPYRESLVEKMQVIDEEYAAMQHKGQRWESLEAKMAEFRKDAQTQAEEEMKAKLQHFKDVELAKMRLEEQEKCRKEVQELRKDSERTHQLKSQALISREKNAIERLQKQQEIEEKEIYMQRQLVLKEIEALRNREADLRQRTEAFEKACKLQQDNTRTTEELLGRRELAVKTLEETYDQKLKNELTRHQLDLKEEYLQRTQRVTEDEKKNKEEKLRLQRDASSIEAKTEDHMRACAELQRLQVSQETTLAQVALLTQQNQLLKERLEAMSDYPSLKRERVELQAQLRLLKRTLEEVQEENHHLRTDLRKPSQEQLVLQAELRRQQNARTLDQEEFQNQRQILQVQLQTEAGRCAQLKAELAECEDRTQRLTSHADDIKMQLRQTQLALENEVLRCPKPSLVDRSVLELAPDRLVPPDVYVDPAVLPIRAQEPHDAPWPRPPSPAPDGELLAGAKARIRQLEREAESLEEAYRSYQQRALRSALSVIQPPRPLSPTKPRHRAPPPPTHAPVPVPQARVTFDPVPQARVTFDLVPQARVTFDPVHQARVTFDPVPALFSDFGSSLPFERPSPDCGSSPPRRLSSTPLSVTRRLITHGAQEDARSPAVTFRGLSPERQLSPIPHSQSSASPTPHSQSGASPSSLPGSPALKSTAREPISSERAQDVLSSSSSSPSPPEKITLDDLTEPSEGLTHIPEPHQDPANQLAEELERGQSPTLTSLTRRSLTPTSPRVRSATPPVVVGSPSDPNPSVHWQEAHQSPSEEGSGPDREDEEEEEREEERKRRQEERQEALERLEQQKLLADQQQEQEVMSALQGGQQEQEQEQEGEGEELGQDWTSSADPLQKYMRLVMQGKSPRKEERVGTPEAEILSEEKENSILAFSHDDPEEDFW